MELKFNCPICMESFSDVHRPTIVCVNGHCVCSACCDKIAICPMCRDPVLKQMIVNRVLVEALSEIRAVARETEIDRREIEMEHSPTAFGPIADIYLAKWNHKKVAIKLLRSPGTSQSKGDLITEVNLMIGLRHPNVIHLFGCTNIDGRIGIVIEYVEEGCVLSDLWGKLDNEQALRILAGIVNGLVHIHSRGFAHMNLKPSNILVYRNVSKISDFGLRRVLKRFAVGGTVQDSPRYSAPEIWNSKASVDFSADIFSLAMICYEMLTKKQVFEDMSIVEILRQLDSGERPEFPEGIVSDRLKDLVVRSWSNDHFKRPPLTEWNEVLESEIKALGEEVQESGEQEVPSPGPRSITIEEQSRSVQQESYAASTIALRWRGDNEETENMRYRMVSEMIEGSSFSSVINEMILKAMKVVPRHLFIDERVFAAWVSNGFVDASSPRAHSYNFRRPMPAFEGSNSSSPEIIGAQLSLLKVEPGSRVLFLGAKGGYIQSLAGQLVGFRGEVVTVSAQLGPLQHCSDVCDEYSPLKGVMKWVHVQNILNAEEIIAKFSESKGCERSDIHGLFDAIFLCGRVEVVPMELKSLVADGGGILAPVGSEESQKICIFSAPSFSKKELVGWGVRFVPLERA